MRKILHSDQRLNQKQRREPAGSSPRTVPIGKRTWTDVAPGKYSFSDYEGSRKVMYLLRHSQHVHREEDGAVQFLRIKANLHTYFLYCPHWSDSKWKACMAGGEGNKKRFQYCTDSSGTIVYLRALQGHSGRSLIDPTLQDNVIIQSNFFQKKLPYWMCVESSFCHQFCINTWRSEFKQETDSILSRCGSHGQKSQGS